MIPADKMLPLEKLVDLDTLKQCLHYNKTTGAWTWLVYRNSRAGPGCRAGTFDDTSNCIKIGLFGVRYLAHRLAWFYVTGEWPEQVIDHWDCDGFNNAWTNLRPATMTQNQGNRRLNCNSSTGLKGVSLNSDSEGYRARISYKGKSYFLGHFETAEEAHEAYMDAARNKFKEFARAA
jgi:hypothetical protein